jgi:fructose-1,6-bisphosphatase/inositol monophosphatase family enzyme
MSKHLCVSRDQVEAALAVLSLAGRRLVEAQPGVRWQLKGDGTFLTDLDVEIQRSLKDRLQEIFPGCVFVGEEDPRAVEAARTPEPRLVLDPIDGTAPFARGLNSFSISLALIDCNGEPCMGIVYMPSRGKWYSAASEISGWVTYAVSVVDGCTKVKPFKYSSPEQSTWKLEDSYVYLSSDAHRTLEISTFQGKVRALGASSSHLALLLDLTPDPAAVILTQYKLWDAIAGLTLVRAVGFEIRDLRQPAETFVLSQFVTELVNSEKTPPLVVGASDTVSAVVRNIKYREGRL